MHILKGRVDQIRETADGLKDSPFWVIQVG